MQSKRQLPPCLKKTVKVSKQLLKKTMELYSDLYRVIKLLDFTNEVAACKMQTKRLKGWVTVQGIIGWLKTSWWHKSVKHCRTAMRTLFYISVITTSCVHSTTLTSHEIASTIAVTRNFSFPSHLSSPMNINFRLEDSAFACKTERKCGNILPENVSGNNYKLLLKRIKTMVLPFSEKL